MNGKCRSAKSVIALFLALLMLFPSMTVAFAKNGAEKKIPYILTVEPQRDSYNEGEEIQIRVKLENRSFSDMLDPEICLSYSRTDTYLVTGDVWYHTDTLASGSTWDKTFNLFENEDNKAAGEKYGSFIAKIVRFFGYLFSRIAPFLRQTEKNAALLKSDFTGALRTFFTPRIREKAGECKVEYAGNEIDIGIYLSYMRSDLYAPAAVEKLDPPDGAYTVDATLTPTANEISGIVFGADIADGAFSGGFFYLNAAQDRAGIARVTDDGVEVLAVKYAAMTPGEAYRVRLLYDGERVKAWLYNDPADAEPYPIFDVPASFEGDDAGVCGRAENVSFGAPEVYAGGTYTNPIYPNSADPFVLYEDGVYYLYATNCGTGYIASTSTNLVHWTSAGQVAFKDDIVGEYYFWAPEVYKYEDRYYLFYSTQGYLAIAVADSPLGPFVKTSDSYLLEREAIDGHVFFDDDGRIWLYAVHFGEGNHLWVYELNDDLISVKEGSGVKLSVPEGFEGTVNEGPAVLKHNGTYYLTYSGDGYTSINYSVYCMTSDCPTGPFTRVAYNPVLHPDTFIHGTGHHCFTTSPDGSEMFIVYHCHYSLTAAEPRWLCIDRVKFVPQENGPDMLVAYGPTVTPQPMPSGAGE